jgi:hypothetical protein
MDEKFNKLCLDLREYATLEGSEIGEYCNLLLAISEYRSMQSDSFSKALVEEMEEQLKNFQENCEIVEKEVTSTHLVKELEWFDYEI